MEKSLLVSIFLILILRYFKIGIIKPVDRHNKVIPLCKSAR